MYLRDDNDELWTSFKMGSFDAFSLIYQNHSHHLFQYGFKIQPNKQILQDAIHDLFVELWASKSRLSQVKSIRFYLLKSLRYKLLSVSQKQQKNSFVDIDDISDTLADENLSELLASQDIKITKIKEALQHLPTRQKEVIYFYFYLSYSIQQIAEIMQINYQSVANLLQRALTALRKLIKLSLLLILEFIYRLF